MSMNVFLSPEELGKQLAKGMDDALYKAVEGQIRLVTAKIIEDATREILQNFKAYVKHGGRRSPTDFEPVYEFHLIINGKDTQI
jgi:hypothetical protein